MQVYGITSADARSASRISPNDDGSHISRSASFIHGRHIDLIRRRARSIAVADGCGYSRRDTRFLKAHYILAFSRRYYQLRLCSLRGVKEGRAEV